MLDRLLLPWRQKPTEAKAETGIGAFWMANDPPLQSLMQDPATKARKAQAIGVSHRWIRASERVISTTLGSVPWHLETDDDEEVTDESDPVLVSIRDLIEKPYRPIEGEPLRPFPRTRSGLWGITSRHMGLCRLRLLVRRRAQPAGHPARPAVHQPGAPDAIGHGRQPGRLGTRRRQPRRRHAAAARVGVHVQPRGSRRGLVPGRPRRDRR
jgi:hypothetical protein